MPIFRLLSPDGDDDDDDGLKSDHDERRPGEELRQLNHAAGNRRELPRAKSIRIGQNSLRFPRSEWSHLVLVATNWKI